MNSDNTSAPDTADLKTGVTVYVCLIGVFGFIGNSLVILAFSQCRRLRTATNVFIVNLCGANVFLSLFELVFSAPSARASHWVYGAVGCSVHGMVEFFFICVAMNTTAAVSVDRYCVITKPIVGAKITIARAIYWTLGIYMYTLIFTIPAFLGWPGFQVLPFHSGCYLRWHAHELSIVYSSIIAVFLFALPYGLMVYCYWSIFLAVRRRKRNPTTKASPRIIPRNRTFSINARPHIRTARMIVLVMFVYLIVWAPCVIASILRTMGADVTFEVFEVTVLIARSNVLWTAVIYGILNERFRTVILILLRCRTGPDWNIRGEGGIFSTSFRDMSFFGHPRTLSITSNNGRKSTGDEPNSEEQKCVGLEALYKLCCCKCDSYSPGNNPRPAAVITTLAYPTVPLAPVEKNATRTQTSVSTLTSPVELSVQSNGVINKSNLRCEHAAICLKKGEVKNTNKPKRVRLSVEENTGHKQNISSSCKQLGRESIVHSVDIHVNFNSKTDSCALDEEEYNKPRAKHSSSLGDISVMHGENKHNARCKRISGSLSGESSMYRKSRHTIEDVRHFWAHSNLLLDDITWDKTASNAQIV